MGGIAIPPPIEIMEDLVAVVDNGPFASAAYCYNEAELYRFIPADGRRKMWFKLPNAKEYSE
jgi:hypothetical protein